MTSFDPLDSDFSLAEAAAAAGADPVSARQHLTLESLLAVCHSPGDRRGLSSAVAQAVMLSEAAGVCPLPLLRQFPDDLPQIPRQVLKWSLPDTIYQYHLKPCPELLAWAVEVTAASFRMGYRNATVALGLDALCAMVAETPADKVLLQLLLREYSGDVSLWEFLSDATRAISC